MTTPLSEVLSTEADAKIVEPEVEAAAETEMIESTAEVTGESEEAAASEDQAAPPAEKQTEDVSEVEKLQAELNAFKAKALDEVSKRQALAQQLEQLKQPVEKPDAFVDPEKAIDHSINGLKTEFENRFLNMSEFNARSRHSEDFDQMTEVFFNEMVVQNPSLQQQAMQHADPYEFIYQQAKTHNEFKGVGSIDDFKARIESELRAKLEAEYAEKQKAAAEQAITNSIPTTLATATAAGGNKGQTFAGPTPLDKIIGG